MGRDSFFFSIALHRRLSAMFMDAAYLVLCGSEPDM